MIKSTIPELAPPIREVIQAHGAVRAAIWGAQRLELASDKSRLAIADTTLRFIDTIENTIENVRSLGGCIEQNNHQQIWLHRPKQFGLRLGMNPNRQYDDLASPAERGLVAAYDYSYWRELALGRKPRGLWEQSRTVSVDPDTCRAMITGDLATLLVAGQSTHWTDTIQATEQEVLDAIDHVDDTRVYHYKWLAERALKAQQPVEVPELRIL